jgi:amicyanin
VATIGEERACNRRRFLQAMALVGTGAIWTALSATAAEPTRVVVDNFSFTPATVSVAVGTTVTWANRDDIPHNVVSTERAFKSPVLDTDQTFSHTFAVAGTFKYYCSLHPRMTGQVVVR